jgi:hypothetical protein
MVCKCIKNIGLSLENICLKQLSGLFQCLGNTAKNLITT